MISQALFLLAVWSWAIWAAAEHWLGNPNYSYGWVVPPLMFGFGLRRYLHSPADDVDLAKPERISRSAALLVLIAILVFALEYAREQVWHPIIGVWIIALFAIASSFAFFGSIGGRSLVRAEIFPLAFFLTALPWPPRLEQPITNTLMRWVALTTTEILHWLGVQAQASGGAIALRNGLVGITEACSGIRSLQTSVMFGLAMGEWFLLSASRRVVLLVIAVALAVATNLARTLTLTLQADAHGIASVERVHDFVGNIIITALVLAIWLAGKLLGARSTSTAPQRQKRFVVKGARIFAPASGAIVIGLLAARLTIACLEAKDQTQTTPFFSAKINGLTNLAGEIPKDVWRELHPTSGEYIRREDVDLASGRADCFHFFWKPSPWNRFALVHRPDICMPGIGWQLDGPAEVQDVDLGGHSLRFYAFRFHRENVHALELWGAWRNGEAVPIDYRSDQVLGVSAPPATMQLEGKRKSATEIVSCSVMAEDRQPDMEKAIETLRAVFDFNPRR